MYVVCVTCQLAQRGRQQVASRVHLVTHHSRTHKLFSQFGVLLIGFARFHLIELASGYYYCYIYKSCALHHRTAALGKQQQQRGAVTCMATRGLSFPEWLTHWPSQLPPKPKAQLAGFLGIQIQKLSLFVSIFNQGQSSCGHLSIWIYWLRQGSGRRRQHGGYAQHEAKSAASTTRTSTFGHSAL